MEFDVIIVLYNSSISAIKSLGIAQLSPYVEHIFICDNSTDAQIVNHNNQYMNNGDHQKLRLIDMEGNAGLARAYNRAINLSSASYICLLDDDTIIPSNYFQHVDTWIRKTKARILAPLAFAQNGMLMSPCKTDGIHFGPFGSIDEALRAPNFSLINAGMVIKRDVFTRYRYDERYRVDMIDHQFIRDMKQQGQHIEIMNDIRIQQDYSQLSNNRRRALKRLRIYAHDSKLYYSHNYRQKVFRLCQLAGRFTKIIL